MEIYPENFKAIEELADEILPVGCILMTMRGSIAHGMYVPDTDPNSIDDIDLMGVYIESPGFYMGLDNKSLGYGGKKTDSQEYWVDSYDIVNYELRKLFGLLLKGNPNVLMLLFLDPQMIIHETPTWNKILQRREVFISQKAYHSFKGYAMEQMRKMTSGTHQGYMGEKRRKLVEQFGYDTKNAAHLIRLLRMGTEYLKRGTMTVNRQNVDAEELLDIKLGKWPLDKVRREAGRWMLELESAKEHSKLPEQADFEEASRLVTRLIRDYYRDLEFHGKVSM
jgi:uncharacterized protein